MNNMFAAADGRCLNTLFICHKSLCLVIANNPPECGGWRLLVSACSPTVHYLSV